MKMLCVHVLNSIVQGTDVDIAAVTKITAGAKFELSDVKACLAALTFILTNSARFSCKEDILSNELQQLGLPKEHCNPLCKCYADAFDMLRDKLRQSSLKVSTLDSVQWRVDYIISSSLLQEVGEPCVQLKLAVKSAGSVEPKAVAFTVDADKFRVLLHELRQANSIMEGMSV